jgi:hypothetical protein
MMKPQTGEPMVATAERGFVPRSQAPGLTPFRAPTASGGTGPTSAFERREQAIRARLGDTAADEFLATGKVSGTGGKVADALGQMDQIIGNLETAYDVLEAQGGAVSENSNALSNLGNVIASTGPGGVAARIAGSQSQTQRDVIRGQQAALLSAIKNATGKSAQELNSIPELQLALRQATDPSVGIQANRQALQFLRDTYINRSVPEPVAAPPRQQRNAPAPRQSPQSNNAPGRPPLSSFLRD